MIIRVICLYEIAGIKVIIYLNNNSNKLLADQIIKPNAAPVVKKLSPISI